VTLTPGSTAPLSSVTLPLSWAVDNCAVAETPVRRRLRTPIERTLAKHVITTSSESAGNR
jgi:hypothetical protein